MCRCFLLSPPPTPGPLLPTHTQVCNMEVLRDVAALADEMVASAKPIRCERLHTPHPQQSPPP